MAQNDPAGAVSAILNPYTPLVYFSPDDGFAVSMMVHVVVGCLAVICWDVVNYLLYDYVVVFHRSFSWRTIVFVVARLSPLGFLLSISVFLTSDHVDCGALHDAWCALFVIARCSTALLFYFRVCAVYSGNRFIAVFFAITWSFVFGASLLTFWGMSYFHVVPTQYCMTDITSKFITTVTFAEVFNDTLIYLAIVYKLGGETWKERVGWWRRMLVPDPKTHLTNVFVQDSLIYYFIAAMMNIIKIITYFSMGAEQSSAIRIVGVFPSTVVINSIALRVFRNMKLGNPGLVPGAAEKNDFSLGTVVFSPKMTKDSRLSTFSKGTAVTSLNETLRAPSQRVSFASPIKVDVEHPEEARRSWSKRDSLSSTNDGAILPMI